MGKTTDLLKKLEQERSGKYTQAINRDCPRQNFIQDAQRGLSLTPKELPQTGLSATLVRNSPRRGLSLTPVLITILLILNLAIALAVVGIFLQKDKAAAKITAIEQIMKENSERLSAIQSQATQVAEEVKLVNSRIKTLGSSLNEIEEANDAQAAAIDNLTKAKNTLFKRVSTLEGLSK